MRENRPCGSEGGEGSTLPDPYQYGVCRNRAMICRGEALPRPLSASVPVTAGRRNASPLQAPCRRSRAIL